MSSVSGDRAWMKLDAEGMWSPAERSGWWLGFTLDEGLPTDAYGPFPSESEAREFLAWALEDAELNRRNEPALVHALRRSGGVRLLKT